MKRCGIGLLLLALLSIGASPTSRGWRYSVLTEMSYPTLQKIVWIDADRKINEGAKVPDALNLMGAGGWELVAVTKDTDGQEPYMTTFYFKRSQ